MREIKRDTYPLISFGFCCQFHGCVCVVFYCFRGRERGNERESWERKRERERVKREREGTGYMGKKKENKRKIGSRKVGKFKEKME